MITDKITEIIKTLISATESDQINWSTDSYDSAYKSEITLSCLSEDGLTKFSISIKYILDDEHGWKLENYCGLWIRNKELHTGSMYVTSLRYPNLTSLRDILRIKMGDLLNPSTDLVEDRLSIIQRGISTSTNRDMTIDTIIEENR